MLKALSVILLLVFSQSLFADEPFYLGGDISSLSELERFGAIYRDHGKPGDCIAILRDHGCNLFRLRLFVNPDHDFDKNYGATQDLPMILALAKRVKSSGAKLSLAIHYSDTWADPAHQTRPAAWNELSTDRLRQKVTDYTVEVMAAMKTNGTVPDIVEVGNETTNGMLWPEGKLGGENATQKQSQWDHYVSLLNAGIRGVRSQSPVDKTRVLIHIDSGGKAGLPGYFFNEIEARHVDFDIIGLSFYPTWNDSIDELKKNLTELSTKKKQILLIETAYPYKPLQQTPQMRWATTPPGQKQFLAQVTETIKGTPDHRGIGVVWWYPEATAVAGHKVWENGSLGWFDDNGELLPAMRSER